jgi:hypothetical protein
MHITYTYGNSVPSGSLPLPAHQRQPDLKAPPFDKNTRRLEQRDSHSYGPLFFLAKLCSHAP